MDTKTRPLHMLSTRDPPQNRGHIQTESEGLEKDFPFLYKNKIDIVCVCVDLVSYELTELTY